MNISRMLTLALFGFLLSACGSSKNIKLVGVNSLDRVFKKGRSLDRTITKAERSMRKARNDFNTAMGLSQKSTYRKGLSQLKSRGKTKYKVIMSGSLPTISTTDAVPSKISNGIKALNGTVKGNINSLKLTLTIPKKSKALVNEVKTFQNRFQKEIANNPMKALTSILKIKTISNNIKIITTLPKRSVKLVQRLEKQLSAILGNFGFKWKDMSKLIR